jgi:YARHG domain
MKNIMCMLFLLAAMVACKPKAETDKEGGIAANENKAEKQAGVGEVAKKVYDKILGSFVGAFGDNKITLLITKAENDSVSGRSVVGGNDRPFNGVVTLKGGKYMITAKEPGNEKHDGEFSFTINEANTDLIEGSWTPYKKEDGAKKIYALQRKSFKYDINAGFYAKASQKLLKENDVENYTKFELERMRNEIFARHGYCFKKKELREHFENEDWYVPNTVNVVPDLTEIEKKNIALIKRYEKYADEYGDDFGR